MQWKAKTLLLLLLAPVLAAGECPVPGSVTELFGTIGNGLGIAVNLAAQQDRLSGTYFYVRYEKLILKKDSGNYYVKLDSAKRIPLNGFCAGGSLTLRESDASGKPVGTFQGGFTKQQIIEGTWFTPDGRKSLPFHLQALLPADRVSGKYRTSDSLQELDILLLDDRHIHIQGTAYWVNEVTGSVHEGEVDSTAKLEGEKAYYVESAGDPDTCRFTIRFATQAISVTDDNSKCGGANVTFEGTYHRVGPPTGNTPFSNPF